MKDKIKFSKVYQHLDKKAQAVVDGYLSTSEIESKDLCLQRKSIQIKNTSEGYISRVTIDHSGDAMIPSGAILNLFKANPVVLYNHKKDELPVAKATNITIKDDGVYSTWEYAEHQKAVDIKKLVKGGFLSTLSIGFIPLDVAYIGEPKYATYKSLYNIQDEPERIVAKWLLLEFSIVVIPDNPNAVITRKSLSDINIAEEKAVEYGLKVVCEGGKCDIFEKNNEGAPNETTEEPNEPDEEVKDPVEDSAPEEEILEIEIELPLEEDEPTPKPTALTEPSTITVVPPPGPEPFLFNRLGKALSPEERLEIKSGKLLWS